MFALVTIFIRLLFLQIVGDPYFLSKGGTHPNNPRVCCSMPADYVRDYEGVSFTTADWRVFRDWYILSRNSAAVIFAHPIGSNRISMLPLADMLAKNDYGVLLFDIRTHGEREGTALPYGGGEAEDMIGAPIYLRAQDDIDPDEIGALGQSLGVQISILATAGSD
jgi:hypothetical protein